MSEVNYRECCGAKAAKPVGWHKSPYPTCNRPAGHVLPHREYRPKTAVVIYEWWEALDLSDVQLRQGLRATAAAERRRLYGARERR